jgi:hypothetical protein
MMAKMTLFVYVPILFSSPDKGFSDKIRTQLLVAAIENAEYNHALNAEHACRHWRWVFQVYTHWYAVVYLLIEISRRPWSPIIERAWVALHSQWLIPPQSHMDKNLRVWIPLRKLMAKARKHREAELERLRSNPQAVRELEIEDQRLPVPGSPGPFPAGSNVVELFRERWRQLLAMPEGPSHDPQTPGDSKPGLTSPSAHYNYTPQPGTNPIPAQNESGLGSNTDFEPAYLSDSGPQTGQNLSSNNFPALQSAVTTNIPSDFAMEQTAGPSYNAPPAVPTNGSMGPGFVTHWLWADTDPSVDVFANVDADAMNVNMDLDSDVDWYNWVESAKGMEWNAAPSGNGTV